MENHICPKCKSKLINKDGKLVCVSCDSSFSIDKDGKLVEIKKVNEINESSSGSNIDIVIKQLDEFLKKNANDVQGFFKKADELINKYPINEQDANKILSTINSNVKGDQLLIYGAGFKNFKIKLKRVYEKDLIKKKHSDAVIAYSKDLQNRLNEYKPGLYSPQSYKKLQSMFTRAKSEFESVSYEEDFENDFKEIVENFSKNAKKVPTLKAIRRRNAGIIVGSILGGSAVIGALVCGAIPTINYEKDYYNDYYGMVENDKHVLEASSDYQRNQEVLKVTGITGLFLPFHFPMPNITIPSEVNGIPVTGVDNYAFENKGINSVTNGENLIWIGEGAFENNNIKNLDFTSSRFLTHISSYAFQNNPELTSVKGLGSVRYIGDNSFKDCKNLKDIDSLDYIQNIGYGAFENTSLSSINIGSNAENIARDAFDESLKINYAGSFEDWNKVYSGPNKTSFDYYIIKYNDPYSGYVYKRLPIGDNFVLSHQDKVGYKFEGYYTKNNGSEMQVTNEKGASSSSFVNSHLSNSNDYIDLYPKYTPITYKVIFNSNGGSSLSNQYYTVEDDLHVADISSKRLGYNFLGWSLSNSKSDIITSTDGLHKDLNLYAIWEKKNYKISTDIPSNSVKINYHYNDSNRVDNTKTYDANSINISNDLYKSGYYFGGWYLDSSFTTKFNANSTLNSEIDLYAKWNSINSVASTGFYDESNRIRNEISSNIVRKTFIVDNSEGLNLHIYSQYNSPTTYVSVKDENGNELVSPKTISSNSSYVTNVKIPSTTGNITLEFTSNNYNDYTYLYYWFENDNNVSYSFDNIKTLVNVLYDESYTIPVKQLPGSVFKGYYTKPDGLGTMLTNEKGNSIKNWDIDDDITAYPYYELTDYTITYNVSDDIVNANSNKTIYNYGDTYVLKDLEKTGYTFEGWFKDASLTEKITSLDGLYEDLVLTPKFKPISADLTLNGLEGIKRSVTFNYLDESISNKTVYLANNEVLYPPKDLDGYSIEWYLDSDLTQRYSFNTSIEEDLILYAKKTTFVNNTSYESLDEVDENNIKSVYVNNSSYKEQQFVANKTGSFNVFTLIANSGYYYKIDFAVYNVTTSETLIDTYADQSSNYKKHSISLNKGDIIKVKYKVYNNANTLKFYFKEASTSTASITSSGNLTVEYDKPFEVIIPTKPGSTFKGYYTEANGAGTMVIDETGKSVSNSTYLQDADIYAYFEETTYTITYHLESGITNPNESVITYNYGDSYSLKDLTKENYVFLGWFDGNTLSASKITDLSSCVGNLDLYARFEGVKINSSLNGIDNTSILVKLDYQDHNIQNEEKYISTETTISLPFEKNDKYYAWYLDKECTIPVSESTKISSNCTLFAKELTSDVTSEYPNILTVNSLNKEVLSTDSTINYYYVPFDMDVKLNYFNSYSGSSYKTHIYVNDANSGSELFDNYVSDTSAHSKTLSLTKGQVIKIYANSVSYYSNKVSYYFEYVSNSYTLATSHDNTLEIEYGSSFTLPVREKLGYNFKGYYTEANGSGTKVTDENGVSISNSTFTTDLNLYAYYEEETYTIEYVYDTTITNPNSSLVSYKYGDTNSIEDLSVETNLTFYGWYDNASFLGEPITSLTGLHKNLTLYAKIDESTFDVVVEGLPSLTSRTVTVNYLLNGVENKVLTLDGNENFVIPNHYREGYRVEWYLDPLFTKSFDQTKNYYGNYTIYAKWIALGTTSNNGQVSQYTKNSTEIVDVKYNYISYYYVVDTDGVLYLNYRAKYNNWMNVQIMNQNGTQLGYAGNISASTSYYEMKFNVTKGEKIQIKVDTNSSSNTNKLEFYFENKTQYSSTSSQVVSIKCLSGLDVSILAKEGYTFKGLYTQSNGQGTQIVDETGAIVSEYTSGTLYAYYVSL